MDWWKYEKAGWSWAVGWNPNYGYYAQAWRDLDQPRRVDGKLLLRECFTEHGKTIAEAEAKLRQRLEDVGN
ncbi:MAG: hypothetical protein ACYTEX_24300 [Planctomycetota bacterium]|jgi:hypothetical protein